MKKVECEVCGKTFLSMNGEKECPVCQFSTILQGMFKQEKGEESNEKKSYG